MALRPSARPGRCKSKASKGRYERAGRVEGVRGRGERAGKVKHIK